MTTSEQRNQALKVIRSYLLMRENSGYTLEQAKYNIDRLCSTEWMVISEIIDSIGTTPAKFRAVYFSDCTDQEWRLMYDPLCLFEEDF